MVSVNDHLDVSANPDAAFLTLVNLFQDGTNATDLGAKFRVKGKDSVARKLLLAPRSFIQQFHGAHVELTVANVTGGARISIAGNWRPALMNVTTNPERSLEALKRELLKRFELL